MVKKTAKAKKMVKKMKPSPKMMKEDIMEDKMEYGMGGAGKKKKFPFGKFMTKKGKKPMGGAGTMKKKPMGGAGKKKKC